MSSMVRASTALLLLSAAFVATPALAEDGREWDQARARLIASQRSSIGQAIERWKLLSTSNRFTFGDYSGFLLTYPGFPDEAKVRVWDSTAETRFIVLPMRPAATEGWSEERLALLVTRDSMIGTGFPKPANEVAA